LTAGVERCHNAGTGRALKFRSASTGCESTVEVACKVAGVAYLVSESREVMNVRQASQYLGISPDTLYRYITEGEIPAFKLGNRWKLRKTILDRWMERKMSQVRSGGQAQARRR
jgi:excisionase family DNA binding protein